MFNFFKKSPAQVIEMFKNKDGNFQKHFQKLNIENPEEIAPLVSIFAEHGRVDLLKNLKDRKFDYQKMYKQPIKELPSFCAIRGESENKYKTLSFLKENGDPFVTSTGKSALDLCAKHGDLNLTQYVWANTLEHKNYSELVSKAVNTNPHLKDFLSFAEQQSPGCVEKYLEHPSAKLLTEPTKITELAAYSQKSIPSLMIKMCAQPPQPQTNYGDSLTAAWNASAQNFKLSEILSFAASQKTDCVSMGALLDCKKGEEYAISTDQMEQIKNANKGNIELVRTVNLAKSVRTINLSKDRLHFPIPVQIKIPHPGVLM